jgi:ABC transport system ATP-binding/permease protein
MAHLLGADRVTLALGTRTLLDEVSLGLDDGQRIGVVGPNGAGKSTLLRVLSGVQQPDDGRVTRAGGVRIAVLDQRDDLLAGSTVLDVVHGSADEHEWATDSRIRSVHAGLLADVSLDADVATLSGGQRRRVALAALLVRDDEVLVLDEPTNHLDVEGVAWLAAHLVERYRGSNGALVVVTHDRWFLDAVCTRTWEVHDGTVDQYEGGYAAYVGTPRTCWRAPSGRGRRRPPRRSGRTCSARSSRGCAAEHPRGRASRSSASTRRTP